MSVQINVRYQTVMGWSRCFGWSEAPVRRELVLKRPQLILALNQITVIGMISYSGDGSNYKQLPGHKTRFWLSHIFYNITLVLGWLLLTTINSFNFSHMYEKLPQLLLFFFKSNLLKSDRQCPKCHGSYSSPQEWSHGFGNVGVYWLLQDSVSLVQQRHVGRDQNTRGCSAWSWLLTCFCQFVSVRQVKSWRHVSVCGQQQGGGHVWDFVSETFHEWTY